MTIGKILRIVRLAKHLLEEQNSESSGDIVCRLDRIEDDLRSALSFGKQYLTKKEAALYLGKTENFIESLIREKEISYFRPLENGRVTYLCRSELDRFITRNMFLSKYQIKAKSKMK